MRRLLLGAALALLAAPAPAHATPIEVVRGGGTNGAVVLESTLISAAAVSGNSYTGWIGVGKYASIAFDVDLTDSNSSVLGVTMTCQTSRSTSTANGSGRDLPVLTVGAADILSRTARWCNSGTSSSCGAADGTAPGSSGWTWMVTNIPAPYLNCKFTSTSGATGADLISVYARGITP